MRCRNLVSSATLAAFMATLSVGCSEGTDVKLATPNVKTVEVYPAKAPTDRKKGGGPGTSRDSTRNPGASN